jgi:RNA recognition motif-containing protein
MSSKRPAGMPFVLRLRGLPYHASSDEVIEFMSGVDLSRECVHIIQGRDGRPSGEAYLELRTESDMKRAMAKHKEHLGSRYVEIFRSNTSELADVLWHGRVNGSHPSPSNSPLTNAVQAPKTMGSPVDSRASGTPSSTATTPLMRSPLRSPAQPCASTSSPAVPPSEATMLQLYIRLRGLPFTATDADVIQFFGTVNVQPVSVLMVPSRSGRPTGECFVELSNDEEVKNALMLHKETMGNRYIEVFRPQRSDMNALMQAQTQFDDQNKRTGVDPAPFSLGEPSEATQSPRMASIHGVIGNGQQQQQHNASPLLSAARPMSMAVGGERGNTVRTTPELTGRCVKRLGIPPPPKKNLPKILHLFLNQFCCLTFFFVAIP